MNSSNTQEKSYFLVVAPKVKMTIIVILISSLSQTMIIIKQSETPIAGYEIDRSINPVLVDTLELVDMQENDKVFLDEVYKGIRLWEGGRDLSEEIHW